MPNFLSQYFIPGLLHQVQQTFCDLCCIQIGGGSVGVRQASFKHSVDSDSKIHGRRYFHHVVLLVKSVTSRAAGEKLTEGRVGYREFRHVCVPCSNYLWPIVADSSTNGRQSKTENDLLARTKPKAVHDLSATR